MRLNKTTFSILMLVMTMGLMQSCSNDPLSPGYEYMPDMYRSPAVEEYVDYGELWDRVRDTLQLKEPAMYPPEGTIVYSEDPSKAHFNYPYPYPNTPDGYEQAGRELRNPVKLTEARFNNAKAKFGVYCTHCHGEKGKGQGILVQRGKFPQPPAYQGIAGLTQGKMFHTLQYGKGNMGSHAGQLTAEERWELVHYVQTLRDENYEMKFKNGLPVGMKPAATADSVLTVIDALIPNTN